MNTELTPQQKTEMEKASNLIASILQQYKLKLVVNNQIALVPMEEAPTEAPVASESAPQSTETPIINTGI